MVHWPSVWEDLKEKYKDMIHRMLNTRNYTLEELPFSILNKWKIFELSKLSNFKNLPEDIRKGFNREVLKLSSKTIKHNFKLF